MSWVIGYLIGCVVTALYGGFLTGRQFNKAARANPGVPINVNWLNVTYQCIVWPAFWASILGEQVERRWKGPDLKELSRRQ